MARISLVRRQVAFDDVQLGLGMQPRAVGGRDSAIRAVVQEQNDMIGPRRRRGAKRFKAWTDPIGFVTGGDGDDDGAGMLHGGNHARCPAKFLHMFSGHLETQKAPVETGAFPLPDGHAVGPGVLAGSASRGEHPGDKGGLSDLTMRHWITSFQ